jgi:hypothetical protein
VVTGTVNGGDTINYTLATTASQFSNVGQYPIDVTLGDNPNYTVVSRTLFYLLIKNSFRNTNRNKQNCDDSDPTFAGSKWFLNRR